MKRKNLRKLITVVSLVASLAIVVPLISSCLPGQAPAPAAPAPAAPEAPAPEAPAPEAPAPKVITAKIGFNGPLTGPVAGWALPGLYGSEMWVERINEEGGILLSDGTRVMLEMVAYDNEYIPDKARAGAMKLVLEDEVVFVQMLGGDTTPASVPFYTANNIMSTTLLAGDLTPETPYLFAPIEVGPMFYFASFDWIGRTYPELRTVAMSAQTDAYGVSTMAAGQAAAEAAGLEVVYDDLFDIATTDFAPVVSAMMATDPDILSFLGSYPDFVNLLVEQAYLQGYEGMLAPFTLDMYDAIIDKTSVEFMEGTVWQFPDYDDPMLTPEQNAFYYEYSDKYPGTWTAVSWEYMEILNVWKYGVEQAGSIDSMEVIKALKASPTAPNAFGEGTWWGRPFFGVDNALMGKWPISQMRDGKSTIVELWDMLDYWEMNKEVIIKWFEEYNLMWYQRMGIPKETAIEQYGLFEEYK